MTDLVVIVPSRNRPERAQALMDAFGATRTVAHLVFAIDDDDPRKDEYVRRFGDGVAVRDTGGMPATMVRALNAVALARASAEDPPFAIGFMGDDHCPQTYGWDAEYVKVLRELGTGMVYGNDLLQGERIPTQVAMTADIIRTLGYMSPPELTHMYVDDFWKDLGTAAGCIRYLPDVIIEHQHPLAGKADWDPGYRRVNAPVMYQRDEQAYAEYRRTRFDADVEKVKALRVVADGG